ncbi:uncharacterized protein LOC125097506 [Lutra lutra]|uniref:uncharacterized protein LOC125097506 n=1 Tax=Lutra lutra TaxID=9657 RepID=UPI001FD1E3A6|nr:uncharacterized protein LOC125097506 [Lutra lutra]
MRSLLPQSQKDLAPEQDVPGHLPVQVCYLRSTPCLVDSSVIIPGCNWTCLLSGLQALSKGLVTRSGSWLHPRGCPQWGCGHVCRNHWLSTCSVPATVTDAGKTDKCCPLSCKLHPCERADRRLFSRWAQRGNPRSAWFAAGKERASWPQGGAFGKEGAKTALRAGRDLRPSVGTITRIWRRNRYCPGHPQPISQGGGGCCKGPDFEI